MSLIIDANMRLFADRMNITSSRMINDYALSTVDEIIAAETERGNTKAANFAREYYKSPQKLIELFELSDVENKFVLLHNMDKNTRIQVLPLLMQEDLVMGLYFFTQEKLLMMLMHTDIEELLRVIKEVFPLEKIVMMFSEDDLVEFMLNKDLEKYDVVEQLKSLPAEVMQKFIEGVTGLPLEETNPMEFIQNLDKLPDDKFKKFMSAIDPDVQRQLTFQLTKQNPDYLELFPNFTYVNMLSKLLKPDMIKPMFMLNKETLVNIMTELPDDLMSIVAAQVDAKEFAKFLQDGNMRYIEDALMI